MGNSYFEIWFFAILAIIDGISLITLILANCSGIISGDLTIISVLLLFLINGLIVSIILDLITPIIEIIGQIFEVLFSLFRR